MGGYVHQDLQELAMQMRFVPTAVRIKQIGLAEQLIGQIDPKQTYPLSFIIFKITEYNPRDVDPNDLFSGKTLISDLARLIEEVCATLKLRVGQVREPIFTAEDLSERFSVSTKTIGRWRYRGLACRRLIAADGKRRAVYMGGVVDQFVAKNPQLIQRGSRFRHLSPGERMGIIDRARVLVTEGAETVFEVACGLSKETGRAVETIRYTILRHDDSNPERAVFSKEKLQHPDEAETIFQCFQAGDRIFDLARRFNRSKVEIHRAILDRWFDELKAQDTEFFYSDDFAAEQHVAPCDAEMRPAVGERSKSSVGERLASEFASSFFDAPLLDADEEQRLFRRLNYLKFRAAGALHRFESSPAPRSRPLSEAQKLLRLANETKERLVNANLRLVASIARRHVRDEVRVQEAISDGCVTLMKTVDRFDYTRGFKFSTYASWAIMRTFARTVPEEAYRRDRFVTGQGEFLDQASDHRESPSSVDESAGEAVRRKVVNSILGQLSSREQAVIRGRFGIGGGAERESLSQIGKRLGLSKERIRQIEIGAIGKLRDHVSPEMVDDLFPVG
jgi:RNA polymerase sigma factor (sigma-70 family)